MMTNRFAALLSSIPSDYKKIGLEAIEKRGNALRVTEWCWIWETRLADGAPQTYGHDRPGYMPVRLPRRSIAANLYLVVPTDGVPRRGENVGFTTEAAAKGVAAEVLSVTGVQCAVVEVPYRDTCWGVEAHNYPHLLGQSMIETALHILPEPPVWALGEWRQNILHSQDAINVQENGMISTECGDKKMQKIREAKTALELTAIIKGWPQF